MRVRVRCFVITGGNKGYCVYDSFAEGVRGLGLGLGLARLESELGLGLGLG